MKSLFVLWLFSSVYWGNHGGDISPGWYNQWSYATIEECAGAGIAWVNTKRTKITAMICQPASFPRPQPMAQPVERK
jgi:hypothetical protein